MKTKQLLTIIGVFTVLALLTIALLQQPRKRFNWRANYEAKNKEPYGAYVISTLLRDYFPEKGFTILKDSLRGQLPVETPANYIFIGERLFLDTLDLSALLAFVRRGNTVLISSLTIPAKLIDSIYYNNCNYLPWQDYETIFDTTATLSLIAPALRTPKPFRYTYMYRNAPDIYRWSYIGADYFCEGDFGMQQLGVQDDSLANFAVIKYGRGRVYLHTTPLVFTNFYLLEKEHLDYANRVFSYLPEGKIYWDERGKGLDITTRSPNASGQRAIARESPVQYLLTQPPLAWAWYLLLTMGLSFLLFRAKRRQRIIPVLQPNTNTSLEFVATIGRLYFLQNSHKKLALQKMKLFQAFVRERYRLRGHEIDAEFVEKLVARSEVSPVLVDKILLMHRNITNSSLVTENTLIEFHQLMDQFYRTCK